MCVNPCSSFDGGILTGGSGINCGSSGTIVLNYSLLLGGHKSW